MKVARSLLPMLVLVAAGCREPNNPAVTVTVRYRTGSLTFSGMRAILSAGATRVATEEIVAPGGSPIATGGIFRIFVDRAYAGRTLTVRVEATEAGLPPFFPEQLLGEGEAESTVLAPDGEAKAIVNLLPLAEVPCPPSGGPGATGCCTPADGGTEGVSASSRASNGLVFAACGAKGKLCVACDLVGSDRCTDGSCGCGSGPACKPGVSCVNGECTCAVKFNGASQCPGCCASDTLCVSPSTDTCGAAGAQCVGCSSDATCGGEGTCSDFDPRVCIAPLCGSGSRCEATRDFPRCRAASGACTVCDLTRSDRCDGAGCACGTQGLCQPHQVCRAQGCVDAPR